jgi:hypothetical protein
MLKIQVVFEEEDGLDPIDPSGEILISDGRVRIWQKHAYLDSWLDALIRGLREVEAGKSTSVDLVEEPDPLMLQPQNGGIKLTYRDTTVSVDSIDEFRRALRSATEDFLGKLDAADKDGETELLNSIRKFSKSV